MKKKRRLAKWQLQTVWPIGKLLCRKGFIWNLGAWVNIDGCKWIPQICGVASIRFDTALEAQVVTSPPLALLLSYLAAREDMTEMYPCYDIVEANGIDARNLRKKTIFWLIVDVTSTLARVDKINGGQHLFVFTNQLVSSEEDIYLLQDWS